VHHINLYLYDATDSSQMGLLHSEWIVTPALFRAPSAELSTLLAVSKSSRFVDMPSFNPNSYDKVSRSMFFFGLKRGARRSVPPKPFSSGGSVPFETPVHQ